MTVVCLVVWECHETAEDPKTRRTNLMYVKVLRMNPGMEHALLIQTSCFLSLATELWTTTFEASWQIGGAFECDMVWLPESRLPCCYWPGENEHNDRNCTDNRAYCWNRDLGPLKRTEQVCQTQDRWSSFLEFAAGTRVVPKSWATFFFCMRTGNSRRRRVRW